MGMGSGFCAIADMADEPTATNNCPFDARGSSSLLNLSIATIFMDKRFVFDWVSILLRLTANSEYAPPSSLSTMVSPSSAKHVLADPNKSVRTAILISLKDDKNALKIRSCKVIRQKSIFTLIRASRPGT